jgi:hypothetical protein
MFNSKMAFNLNRGLSSFWRIADIVILLYVHFAPKVHADAGASCVDCLIDFEAGSLPRGKLEAPNELFCRKCVLQGKIDSVLKQQSTEVRRKAPFGERSPENLPGSVRFEPEEKPANTGLIGTEAQRGERGRERGWRRERNWGRTFSA